MKKCAVIRGEQVRSCPFGLPVPSACMYAGDSIGRMAPLEHIKDDKIKSITKANKLVYAYHRTCKKCPYADKILEVHNKVDCDFGDTGEGQQSTSFIGSPLYPQTFCGTGLDGLHGYPLGFYADNNESRNLFFGLFSLLGFNTIDDIIKLANTYDSCEENEKADIVDNLLNKLYFVKKEYTETFNKVEKYLKQYRTQYEDKRNDTGLLWELSNKRFGPQQVNR